MKFLDNYKGLRKEIYILFYGRIVTNMGSVVGSMMTLILSTKLNFSPSDIAMLLMVMGIIDIPVTILGGKFADKYNKKNMIIICDLITVSCFIACAFIPMSITCIAVYYFGTVMARFEWPSYDALVADLSKTQDRERAYSLNYLGANLGIVLAPTIGGFLFKNYLWLAFIITAVATLSSTILIFFKVKDISVEVDDSIVSTYEESEKNLSLRQVLKSRKLVYFFIICTCISSLVYSQFNYLIPLNYGYLYGEEGAKYFGTLTSVNALVVILFTPLITTWFKRIKGVKKVIIGESLITIGLASYIFIQGVIPLYYVAMIVFTFGEIFNTLGQKPYLTKRVPATHRGRIAGIAMLTANAFATISQNVVGELVEKMPYVRVWMIIGCVGAVGIILYTILYTLDKKKFPLLYEDKIESNNEKI